MSKILDIDSFGTKATTRLSNNVITWFFRTSNTKLLLPVQIDAEKNIYNDTFTFQTCVFVISYFVVKM